ncbi:hypothetical protein MRB53_010338 [Persea americana]|uniref:Uncharacterized protein n=1 Tax=Persea americana TaxID=3435 RepID=A0ACC2LRF8_PERAE|nr:hypothetical protein MRB53_010338 [Persea americana]
MNLRSLDSISLGERCAHRLEKEFILVERDLAELRKITKDLEIEGEGSICKKGLSFDIGGCAWLLEFELFTVPFVFLCGLFILISYSELMGSQARRRTRGPNRCIALNNLQERIVIKLNEYNQPIGQTERLLSSYLGIIARDGQKAPINFVSWRRMPAEMKEEMWEVAQTKFDIAERAKKWVFSKLSHSWRNWKCELKRKYYNPFPTVQEQLQQCPNRVNRRQWVSLVKFWGSHAGKKLSKTNAKNRSEQKMSHTAGTKSFARIRHEELYFSLNTFLPALDGNMGAVELEMANNTFPVSLPLSFSPFPSLSPSHSKRV